MVAVNCVRVYAGWRREEAEMKKEGKQASEGETGANEQVSAVTGLTAIGKQSRR